MRSIVRSSRPQPRHDMSDLLALDHTRAEPSQALRAAQRTEGGGPGSPRGLTAERGPSAARWGAAVLVPSLRVMPEGRHREVGYNLSVTLLRPLVRMQKRLRSRMILGLRTHPARTIVPAYLEAPLGAARRPIPALKISERFPRCVR